MKNLSHFDKFVLILGIGFSLIFLLTAFVVAIGIAGAMVLYFAVKQLYLSCGKNKMVLAISIVVALFIELVAIGAAYPPMQEWFSSPAEDECPAVEELFDIVEECYE